VNADHLVSTYGYWAVVLFVMLESLGVPLPGETILIAAAIYAGNTHHLSVWGIWALASIAAVVGDNIGFWIGDKGGYRLLRKYGRYIHVREPELKVGRYIFDRYGGPVVFFGRFVSILRTYAAFLAGTNRMHWRKFFVYNLAGGVVWAGIWTFLAYYLGNGLKHASGTVNLLVGIAAVIAIVVAIVVVRRYSKRLEAVAEAAYPGPLPD
jgi:membrane protein DedA with SNARE-associated domain